MKYGLRECVECGAKWEEEVPPVESIQYLLNVFIKGDYAENDLDIYHIDKIHEWLAVA